MKDVVLTQQTVRCPLEDCTASLTVRTHRSGDPSRRHREVAACSLRPSTSFVAPEWRGYFSDVAPPIAFLHAFDRAPRYSSKVACSRRCLAILNAAEVGAEPLRCTSGCSDAPELARQVQSPRLTRLLWYFSG